MDFSVGEKRIIMGLICASFTATLGMGSGLLGPALLDLTEIYGTTLKVLSTVFIIRCVAGSLGSFTFGYIMDKYPKWRLVFLSGLVLSSGIALSLYPHCVYIPLFFVLNFVAAFATGGLNSSGNLLCLYLWRGEEGSPYMHSIHFSFSLGTVIAPLIAAPFLSNKPSYIQEISPDNITMWTPIMPDEKTPSRIYIPYFILGGSSVVVAAAILYFALKSLRRMPGYTRIDGAGDANSEEDHLTGNGGIQHNDTRYGSLDASFEREGFMADLAPGEDEVNLSIMQAEPSLMGTSKNLIITVVLFTIFCFSYVGIESTYGMYLTPFAVDSELHLSKSDGAFITSIYWGCFATMRFLAIWASVALNPLVIMVISFVLSLVSTIALALYGNTHVWVLQVASGVFGFGNASVYATGLLWLESMFPVTGMAGAIFTIASSIGPTTTALIMGQFVTMNPMALMYLALGIVLTCVVFFLAAAFFGARAKKDIERREAAGVLANVE